MLIVKVFSPPPPVLLFKFTIVSIPPSFNENEVAVGSPPQYFALKKVLCSFLSFLETVTVTAKGFVSDEELNYYSTVQPCHCLLLRSRL